MKTKYVSIFAISIIIVFGVNIVPVTAGLNEGGFMPSCKPQSIPVDGRVQAYRVQKGDTLWGISKTYNVDLKTICMINNLEEESLLAIGQTLDLPYSRPRIHTISKGETMWDIAAKYDISLDELIKLNKSTNPKRLKIGDKLQIPGSTIAADYKEPSRGFVGSNNYFVWPLIGTITSPYGWRKSGFHHGLDIAGSIGDIIRASAAGVVSFSGYKSVYGRTLIIDHGDGKQTLYAHLQHTYVSKGEKVLRSQTIGTVGMTGNTTGPHLHFEVKQDEKTHDPLKFLNR